MSWVVVIPKEGWAGYRFNFLIFYFFSSRCHTKRKMDGFILLLVWQRLRTLGTFLQNATQIVMSASCYEWQVMADCSVHLQNPTGCGKEVMNLLCDSKLNKVWKCFRINEHFRIRHKSSSLKSYSPGKCTVLYFATLWIGIFLVDSTFYYQSVEFKNSRAFSEFVRLAPICLAIKKNTLKNEADLGIVQ